MVASYRNIALGDNRKPVAAWLGLRDVKAWRSIITTPLTTPNKLSFLPVILVGGALFSIDSAVEPTLKNQIYPWYNSSFSLSTVVGDRLIGMAPLLLFAAGGDNEPVLLKTGLALGDAALTAVILAQVSKQLTGRSRPSNGPDAWDWGHINTNNVGPYTSFPSLHATTYSAAATVIGKMLDCELPANLFFLALFTGDMAGHKHWVSDMVLGAWFGRAIGEYWLRYYQMHPVDKDAWLLCPYVNPATGGNFEFAFTIARHF